MQLGDNDGFPDLVITSDRRRMFPAPWRRHVGGNPLIPRLRRFIRDDGRHGGLNVCMAGDRTAFADGLPFVTYYLENSGTNTSAIA